MISILKRLDLETENLYSADSAGLIVGSLFVFLTVTAIEVVFQPRGHFIWGIVFLIYSVVLVVFSIWSAVFLIVRLKKYGLPLAIIPLMINLATIGAWALYGQQRLYLSDPDLITTDRCYSPNRQYVAFAYTLNDGMLGTPWYTCVIPVADTAENLSGYRLPHGWTASSWNADQSLNVSIPTDASESDRRQRGHSLDFHGIVIWINF
jgi:hypothetical protein